MADEEEKTEQPTSKKIEKAREEGNVGKSADVVGAAVLFFGSLYILFFSAWTFDEIKSMMLYVYSFIGKDLDGTQILAISINILMSAGKALMPIFVITVLIALAANWSQFGFLSNPLKFDFQRLDPIRGLKNLFSVKKLIDSLKLFLDFLVRIDFLTHYNKESK